MQFSAKLVSFRWLVVT